MTKTVSEIMSDLGATAKGMAKIALQSRRCSIKRHRAEGDAIVIMGNGPSLADTIKTNAGSLRSLPAMAVNFAANAPEFADLQPRYYILVDPHFFVSDAANVKQLWGSLASVSWHMTLIVPVKYRHVAESKTAANTHIDIATVNTVGAEGFGWFTRRAYRSGRAMPRPRNVLIPAIMAAMAMGYRQVYITGADHSWMQTISVNERNEVVSIQPHFYKDDDKELKRIRTDYLHYPLHTIVHSFYVAFKAYHDIRRYADAEGVTIYNSTPGSFIDAFDRRPLP